LLIIQKNTGACRGYKSYLERKEKWRSLWSTHADIWWNVRKI